MTAHGKEWRIRCSGEGKRHSTHIYPVTKREYVEKQRWPYERGCLPFIVEERSVGLWVRSGQQVVL